MDDVEEEKFLFEVVEDEVGVVVLVGVVVEVVVFLANFLLHFKHS